MAQIDQVDNLPKKNLLTYMVRSRLLEQDRGQKLQLAGFHAGPELPRRRSADGSEGFCAGRRASARHRDAAFAAGDGSGRRQEIFRRLAACGHREQRASTRSCPAGRPGIRGGAGAVSLAKPPINQYVTVDAFFDPYSAGLSQFNTDFRVQQSNEWYVEVGQRFSRNGNRVQRGDLWNPISFNQVFDPTNEVQFLTAGGAFRTPFGWLVGAKGYYDINNRQSPEYDVVALYQNPCKCWSLGLFYLQFPDRAQYNFMLSLTGVGWTENYGTNVVKQILSPLTWGEKGLPWASPGGHYGHLETAQPQPRVGGAPR